MKTRKPRQFRLIPLTFTMLGLLLVIKVNELYIGSRELRELYSVRDATAAEEKKPEAPAETKEDLSGEEPPAKAEDAKQDSSDKKSEDAKPEDAQSDEKEKPETTAADEKKEEPKKEESGHGEAKPAEDPRTYGTGKSTVKQIEAQKAKMGTTGIARFTRTELDLLENLSKRRDELDLREKELDVKATVLQATQQRINDKLGEMKKLEAELNKILALYNDKQNAQIMSLVKIYETMKPGQAAAIFNELDLPILLEVIDKMSERKVAPVLAMMDPKKARDVTQELAAMRKANADKVGAVNKR